MTKDRVILGIDPGTIVMGYGVLTIEGNKPKLEAMGILQLNKYEDHYLRLRKIFERVLGLIDQYHPDELAIEAPFFGKNVQSMLKLGRAQGVAMAAALERDIPIFEYAPLKIKMSITGNGNAAKEQVAGCYSATCIFRKHPCCRNWMRQMDWQLPFAIISRRIIRYRKRNIPDGRTLSRRIRVKFIDTKKDACNYRHPPSHRHTSLCILNTHRSIRYLAPSSLWPLS